MARTRVCRWPLATRRSWSARRKRRTLQSRCEKRNAWAIASEFKKDLVGEVRSILKSEMDSVLLIDNVRLIAKLEGVRARHRAFAGRRHSS